ncbi:MULTISPECIES: hypothetical protein [Nocardiopsidaceae]|jgi:hypothetical protein|uniref:Uncharacterized protein n=2 Tax=Nocardiopsidaceae TaxID=83676 RepID=A0ABY6YSB6_9ACTN|nr:MULTISPECIES: hypothetical protein [Nocardiopsaceae]MEE2049313.1 hypothetical protein [Nocardiopsis umidischolae]WAE74998.1 hypothetical protein OUQ99_07900 [Streptomonospora nanhaiensis]
MVSMIASLGDRILRSVVPQVRVEAAACGPWRDSHCNRCGFFWTNKVQYQKRTCGSETQVRELDCGTC